MHSIVLGGTQLAATWVCGAARSARLARGAAFLAVAGAPWVVFHGVLGDVLAGFRLDLGYLLAVLSPWMLIAAGIAFLVPVAWSAGADPEGRFYPRARSAYLGWGLTLYLLGVGLASMVAQLSHLSQG
ncbi:MAG: hypothetical protein ACR2K9_00790 [Solirubrobacteraceae bacterium]